MTSSSGRVKAYIESIFPHKSLPTIFTSEAFPIKVCLLMPVQVKLSGEIARTLRAIEASVLIRRWLRI